jgi:flagellar motor switch protein FliG
MPLTGRDFASRVLPELVDEGRRGAVIGAIRRRVGADFPDFIRGRSPAAVAGVLVDEHPQVRAVALLRMGPENAAKVLALFDAETQTDITMRMARAERVSGELADDVENSIRRSLEDRDDPLTMDGASGAARILGRMPRERNVIVLEQVRERQGQLADEIQRLMIVFEDLNFLDDRAIQALLRVVERADLVAALKGADPATREKFLKNLSSRAATDLAEEIEMLSGVRRSAIRQAQQNVVTAAQKLHDTGVIVLLPGGGEDN